MIISKQFPSKYLKATDIKRTAIWKIIQVELDTMQDGEKKPVCYFKDQPKGLVLNVTNRTALAEAYGDDTVDWEGKEAELFTMPVTFNGVTKPAIRVRIPEPPDFDDDIPQ